MIPFLIPLRQHQINSADFLDSCPTTFDMSDAGTGKTATHLAAWGKRRSKGGGRMLVLAPKSILYPAWGADIEKFCPWFSYTIATAGPKWRAALKQETDILITNFDRAKVLSELKPSFWDDFDTIVFDESDAFKHRTSGRSKAARKLVKNFEFRNCLSGTPFNASVTELWHQQLLLDDGALFGTNFFRFRNIVQYAEQVGPQAQHVRWTDKPGAIETVTGLMASTTIRNKFEECVDIPPNDFNLVHFNMSAKHRDIYEEFIEDSIAQVGSEVITAVHAANRTEKGLQICSGAVYSGDDDEYVLVDSDRYSLIVDMVKQRQHPCVVFFSWKHQRVELGSLLDKEGVTWDYIDGSVGSVNMRNDIVADFQAGKIHCLLLHPQAAAHGLTLTRGRTTIWANPIRNPAHFKQGSARIYRTGQEFKTETVMVAAADTFEEQAYAVLQERKDRLFSVLDYLET